MDRTQQRAAFQNAIQPFFDAQDNSDAAAEKAGATRMAREKAQREYQQAATPGKKEALAPALLALQDQDAADTQAATDLFVASQNAYVPLAAAFGALQTNPGAVEQV